MSKTKPKPIKAALGFTKMASTDILARGNAVYSGTYGPNGSKDFPNPPVEPAAFKGAIDLYSTTITDALDGGKKAIAARNHQGEVVIKMLRQVGHYVEANCKDDMKTFLSSGFEVASTARTPAQPLSQSIRKIDPGKNSGQLLVSIVAIPGALSYELRSAPVGAGGAPGTWTTQPVGKVRPPALVASLTPGVNYAFQVRAVTKSGYTDWSDSLIRMCT